MPKALRFTLLFTPGRKWWFACFFQKIMKKYVKTWIFQKWKHENHRKSDFYKVLTSVGAGKSAFSVFYEKAGNSLKFTKFMEIPEISINLVN